MMYFNKIYSRSTERIITRTPLNNTFDIELQHPQPRRRQTIDQHHENNHDIDPYGVRTFSIPSPKPEEFHLSESHPRSLRNNFTTTPTNPLFITTPESSIIPPAPEIVEER